MTRQPREFVSLTLPRPISTNELFVAVGNRRVVSAKYAAWRKECGQEILAQSPGRVEGHFALTVRVPAKWRGDVSNSCKAIEDLLVAHGITGDDRLAERILLERWPESFVQVLVVSTRQTAP